KCSDMALSDKVGIATFYELPMPGNGSLLQPNSDRWAEFNQWKDKTMHSFEVRVSTLDVEATGIEQIDLLWIDVQGAEGNVLKGASKTIKRVAAVFLETALVESPYQGAVLFPDLDAMLKAAGFTCVGLGIDGWNFTGNAFWVRDIALKTCRSSAL
ncbi:MAG TPA: FkbM family methyltransferase, partial [Chthoniobacterales bacterium]|nr:FkbM family methyltransferase [Chthoniobacterales bacterium]